ncbi:MAG: septum formation initiator family protein [Gemmatimonadota bacterium]
MTPARWIALAALAAAAIFSVEGGEYSVFDHLKLKRVAREETERVAQLQRAVDSLKRVRTAVEGDSKVQERVAREKFGMIGKGEFVYKILPDSEP